MVLKEEVVDLDRLVENKEGLMMKILTVKEIKEILGCGINRAYDIVQQDDFPKIKIGSRY